MIVVQICGAVRLDAPRKVGKTLSTAHGWRPNSASSQPDSMAIQGSGIITTANSSSHFVSCRLRVTIRKAAAKNAMKAKPMAAMMRKTTNSTGTSGTVSQAAFWISAGLAVRGSATYRFSNRP